jgi:hypothetical protein
MMIIEICEEKDYKNTDNTKSKIIFQFNKSDAPGEQIISKYSDVKILFALAKASKVVLKRIIRKTLTRNTTITPINNPDLLDLIY